MRERIDIPAMRESDLRELFSSYGLAEKIENNQIECEFCGSTISWSNLGGVIIKDSSPHVICSLSECIEKAAAVGTGD